MKKNTFRPLEAFKLFAQLAFVAYGLMFLGLAYIALCQGAWSDYFSSLIK